MKNCKKYMAHYLFTLIVFILTVTGCSESHGKKPKQKHFTEVGNYIEFQLEKESFKIDKKYFKGGGKNHLKKLQSVKFWALLPGFEAYDKGKNDYEFVDRLGWGDKIYFSLYPSTVNRNSISLIVSHNSDKDDGFSFSGRLGEPDGIYYGLQEYTTNRYQSDTYLSITNGVVNVYITCTSTAINAPSPSCRMMWDPFESVYAEATFSKNYLSQWKTILIYINKIYAGKNLQGN